MTCGRWPALCGLQDPRRADPRATARMGSHRQGPEDEPGPRLLRHVAGAAALCATRTPRAHPRGTFCHGKLAGRKSAALAERTEIVGGIVRRKGCRTATPSRFYTTDRCAHPAAHNGQRGVRGCMNDAAFLLRRIFTRQFSLP